MQRPILICAVGFSTVGFLLSVNGRAQTSAPLGVAAHRNHVASVHGTPIELDCTQNLVWSQSLGTHTNGSPVIADGKLFIGTNNGSGHLERFPSSIDLGVLLCLDTKDGELLWQYSCEKLPTGKLHDWPEMGICSTPLVQGERLWFVSSRGEVVCLDSEGFRDGENDGPYRHEDVATTLEADIIWRFDMMGELGVQQHNMANCSVALAGDTLLVCTGNGVDRSHQQVAAPEAPSFLGLDAATGNLLWSDASPGRNILHGQWSSPAFAVIAGVPQAIFAGGDGWLYSFDPRGNGAGGVSLLWKFDCNPKAGRWNVDSELERNNIIATPVIYRDRVYVATGQSPDRGQGPGRLWCVDAAQHIAGGDVSVEKVFDVKGNQVPPRREQAMDRSLGERAVPNAQSAAVWCYQGGDQNHDGYLDYYERMHRSIGTVVIDAGLVLSVDFAGIVHCVDLETGEPQWTCDLLAQVWASPLIVGNRIFVADDSGTLSVFRLHRDPHRAMKRAGGQFIPWQQRQLDSPIRSTPTYADGVLYLATQRSLFAVRIAR